MLDMNEDTWEECIQQHSLWKEMVTMGEKRYEQAFIHSKEVNRQKRKQLLVSRDENDGDAFNCEQCSNHCPSRIGLFSHMQTHLIQNI